MVFVYVVVHCLDPVAAFEDRAQANVFAQAINGDVYVVPVVKFDCEADGEADRLTDGD